MNSISYIEDDANSVQIMIKTLKKLKTLIKKHSQDTGRCLVKAIESRELLVNYFNKQLRCVLYYLTLRIENGENRDAPLIFNQFVTVKECIFLFYSHILFKKTELKQLIEEFVVKLVHYLCYLDPMEFSNKVSKSQN